MDGGGGGGGGGRYGGSRQSVNVLPDCELWFCCDDVFLLPKPLLLDRLSGDVSVVCSGEASSGALRAIRACRGNSRARGRVVITWPKPSVG